MFRFFFFVQNISSCVRQYIHVFPKLTFDTGRRNKYLIRKSHRWVLVFVVCFQMYLFQILSVCLCLNWFYFVYYLGHFNSLHFRRKFKRMYILIILTSFLSFSILGEFCYHEWERTWKLLVAAWLFSSYIRSLSFPFVCLCVCFLWYPKLCTNWTFNCLHGTF